LAARIAYDVCFFVVIIVLLLNIIFGIIIDTFGQLREESSEKQELMASFCFICGISKDVFDSRASNGAMGGVGGLNFAGHIESEHNMWDYMLFLLYLQEKNPNDYNGIERSVLTSLRLSLLLILTIPSCSYVAKLFEEGDISWVPKGVARGINDATNLESAHAEQRMQSNMEYASPSTSVFLSFSLTPLSHLAASLSSMMEATVAKHTSLQMAENDKVLQTLHTLESQILQLKVSQLSAQL
jgi:inositol 1,4,5-triphosphate receptor type 3